MKFSFNKLVVISIVLLFFGASCNKKKVKSNRQIMFERLMDRYNHPPVWDLMDDDFAISYQDVLKTDFQVINRYEINDIYSRNDSLFAFVEVSIYPTFYFDLYIDKEIEGVFLESENNILLVKIESISKNRWRLINESSDEMNISSVMSDDDSFSGKGCLIEVIDF